MDELMARLRVALRAPAAEDEAPVIETADFVIDLANRRIRRGDQDVRLTATEWQLVEVLDRHPGKLITQRQPLQDVPGLREAQTKYPRVLLLPQRRKPEPAPAQRRDII